jgi:hypothetical protein
MGEEEFVLLSVRVSPALSKRIEEWAAWARKYDAADREIRTSDAVRTLLTKALDRAEQDRSRKR